MFIRSDLYKSKTSKIWTPSLARKQFIAKRPNYFTQGRKTNVEAMLRKAKWLQSSKTFKVKQNYLRKTNETESSEVYSFVLYNSHNFFKQSFHSVYAPKLWRELQNDLLKSSSVLDNYLNGQE